MSFRLSDFPWYQVALMVIGFALLLWRLKFFKQFAEDFRRDAGLIWNNLVEVYLPEVLDDFNDWLKTIPARFFFSDFTAQVFYIAIVPICILIGLFRHTNKINLHQVAKIASIRFLDWFHGRPEWVDALFLLLAIFLVFMIFARLEKEYPNII